MMSLQTQLFDEPPDNNPLDLPPFVLCLSLWQPYAGLVVAGIKTIETREWDWPYPTPSWLVIHAAKSDHPNHFSARVLPWVKDLPREMWTKGVYLGLVRVDKTRAMTPSDEDAAFVGHKPVLKAWELSNATQFTKPVPVERGPQKFVRLPRSNVLEWLEKQ